jgi:hypothetical protein
MNSQIAVLALSPLMSLPHEVFVAILSFADRPTLGRCLAVSRALFAAVDSDALWKPIATGILNSRLCLLPDVHESVVNAPTAGRGVCRCALARAFVDAKRCAISTHELTRQHYWFRFRRYKEIQSIAFGMPENMTPCGLAFGSDGILASDPGELFFVRMTWAFVPPAHGFQPVDGGRLFVPPPDDAPPPDFCCISCGRRPPMRVWRHPTNWAICMNNHVAQVASFRMRPMGEDLPMETDSAYLHPYNFVQQADSSDDDMDAHGDEEADDVPLSTTESVIISNARGTLDPSSASSTSS